MPAPAKKATAYVLRWAFVDQANTKLLKANPTLAAGDVKIARMAARSPNHHAADRNARQRCGGTKSLSSTEMNADNVVVLFSDAAGAEWCDQFISINTNKTLDDALAISNAFKKNTAVTLPFRMTDATTHALTLAPMVDGYQRSIDGAAFASAPSAP